MRINNETIEHLKRWEGLRLEAYPDPGSKDGHPLTIGYGHTSDSKMKVTKGLVITEAQAEDLLRHDAGEALEAISSYVKVPLTDNQAGALVSFAYNVGIANFRKSTLLKKLNKGQYDAVPSELAKWKYNDGKVMKGLVNRRAAEAGLWAKGEFVASREVKATTPPVLDRLATPEGIGAAGGAIAGISSAMAGTGPVQWAIAAVLILGAAALLYKVIKK